MPTDIGAGATLEWLDRDSMFEATLAERTLRIFVSSPSDVAAERARVKPVADRLNGQLEGVVRLEVLRWEDAFYTAAHSFQEAIDQAIGNMSQTDMVLCIVWKRAGLKLNPAIWRRKDGSAYESGTVLEYRDCGRGQPRACRRARRVPVPEIGAGGLRRRPRRRTA